MIGGMTERSTTVDQTIAYGRDLRGPLFAVTDVPMDDGGTAWQVWEIPPDRAGPRLLTVTDDEPTAVRIARALSNFEDDDA